MLNKNKRAALAICAILCGDKSKKKRRRRVWTRNWLGRRGQYGLSILQRELEVSSNSYIILDQYYPYVRYGMCSQCDFDLT